jgi:hypothetical protein
MNENRKGSRYYLSVVIPQHFPSEIEKILRTNSIRIVGVPAEIRTDHIPKASQEYYRFVNPSILFVNCPSMRRNVLLATGGSFLFPTAILIE